MRITIFIIVNFLLTLFGTTLLSQDKLSVDNEHIAGVMEAHLASLEGWRTGDVLIRVKSSGHGRYLKLEEQGPKQPIKYVEGPDASSVVVQSDLLFRLVFDVDIKRALVIGRREEERQVFDALDNEAGRPLKRAGDNVGLFDATQNIALSRVSNGPIRRFDELPKISSFLISTGAPDIRGLGSLESPFGPWNSQGLESTFESRSRSDLISRIVHVGKDRYQAFYDGENRTEGQKAFWEWDVNRQVPLRFWLGEETTGDTFLENAAEWKLIDGSYVPASGRFMHTNLSEEGARRYMVITEGTIDLHWFSFNQPLSDELFDESLLRDRRKLDELMSEEVFDNNPTDRTER